MHPPRECPMMHTRGDDRGWEHWVDIVHTCIKGMGTGWRRWLTMTSQIDQDSTRILCGHHLFGHCFEILQQTVQKYYGRVLLSLLFQFAANLFMMESTAWRQGVIEGFADHCHYAPVTHCHPCAPREFKCFCGGALSSLCSSWIQMFSWRRSLKSVLPTISQQVEAREMCTIETRKIDFLPRWLDTGRSRAFASHAPLTALPWCKQVQANGSQQLQFNIHFFCCSNCYVMFLVAINSANSYHDNGCPWYGNITSHHWYNHDAATRL
jgi:hypothetical protein